MNESDSPGFNDVLTEWRWWYEVIMWPSAPNTFRAFWGKVESCGLLKLLCEAPEYEKKWKDPLIFHLGEMWMMGPVRGRLHVRFFQRKRTQQDLIKLSQKWCDTTLPTKTNVNGSEQPLSSALTSEHTPSEKSMVLLGTSLHTTKAVIRNALSRAGALTVRQGYCPGCKVTKLLSNQSSCSLCFTRAHR
ncbi:MAG: hypothetical protein ABIU05_18205 [Nitrospirales bacterium]